MTDKEATLNKTKIRHTSMELSTYKMN